MITDYHARYFAHKLTKRCSSDSVETDRKALEQEIADLDAFTELATSIAHNAKGLALLKALDVAFAKADEIKVAQKAIIRTTFFCYDGYSSKQSGMTQS